MVEVYGRGGGPAGEALRIETGRLDPLLGRSLGQLSAESRSQHRSQEMGRPQPAGPQSSTLSAVDPGPVLAPGDVFEGVSGTLVERAHAWAARDDGAGRAVLERLRAYDALARSARESYRPALGTGETAALLARAAAALDSAYAIAAAVRDDDGATLRFHIAAERADVARAAIAAAGVVRDGAAPPAGASPGGTR